MMKRKKRESNKPLLLPQMKRNPNWIKERENERGQLVLPYKEMGPTYFLPLKCLAILNRIRFILTQPNFNKLTEGAMGCKLIHLRQIGGPTGKYYNMADFFSI